MAKALVQRAVAYQQLKNYTSALADFNEVINDHKDAKEREMALEQKALILGQQDDPRAMTDAFRALLKDYPKTDAAGLAHYYIANAAFEGKDYPTARAEFERRAAGGRRRSTGAKASLMVILCEYQLKDKREAGGGGRRLPESRDGNRPCPRRSCAGWASRNTTPRITPAAEAHLTGATTALGNAPSDAWLLLARARLTLESHEDALDASETLSQGRGARNRRRARRVCWPRARRRWP